MGRASDQQGFTLVELLVGMVLALIVLGAVANLLEGAYKLFLPDQDRAHAAEEPLAGAARMVRELRGADQVVDMTGNAVDVIVSLNGQLLRVRYDCDVAGPRRSGQPLRQHLPAVRAARGRRDARRGPARAARALGRRDRRRPHLPRHLGDHLRLRGGRRPSSHATPRTGRSAPARSCRRSRSTPTTFPRPTTSRPSPSGRPTSRSTSTSRSGARGRDPSSRRRISFDDGVYLRNVDLRYAGAAS